MFENITPEQAGISSSHVLNFIKELDQNGLFTHSIIMARGNKIFSEVYYRPFDKDFKHRMYSVTKSFVGVAVGLAIEDGLLSLDDKFVKFFPEYLNENTTDYLREATIRDLLTMRSAVHTGRNWFIQNTDDRVKEYFVVPADKIPGTVFEYDSNGSYMLGVIVEKLTGMKFLDYMRKKFLDAIGFSKDAYCLMAPGGYSFGDSAMMCTPRDLLLFARFVMNKGTWNGKRYMNEQYLTEATSRLVENSEMGIYGYDSFGYGYQIWQAPEGGFAFVGMGDQFAICDPKHDFIFIINSDNQGNSASRSVFYNALYREIVHNLGEPLGEDAAAYSELCEYCNKCELHHFEPKEYNPFEKKISNVTYELDENPMGIKKLSFSFEGKKGAMSYTNAQGDKTLYFGMGYNEFGIFPEDGYSDNIAGNPAPGNKYRCACSAEWSEEKKLRIRVQIIDKYFGNGCFTFSFKDSRITALMTATAENFMMEYRGLANGRAADFD